MREDGNSIGEAEGSSSDVVKATPQRVKKRKPEPRVLEIPNESDFDEPVHVRSFSI